MSYNAYLKRRAKIKHKNEFSKYPVGKVDIEYLLSRITPQSTPLTEMIARSYGR